jgi:uncharacterized protein YbaP (TraB family)
LFTGINKIQQEENIMRRQIIVLFLALFWLAFAAAAAPPRGALFLVTANGHTMHLFGTMHVGLPQFYPLEPRLMAALDKASTLALELDPDQPPAVMLAALRAHGMASAGAANWSALEPVKRQHLEQMVRQAGLDPAIASNFKPALLAAILSLSEFEKIGYRAQLAADRFLAQRARAAQVRIVELESIDAQLALLDRMPVEQQWRFLDETTGAIESGAQQEEARKVVDAWGSADQHELDALSERIAGDNSLSGRFTREVLLDGRNDALADKMARLLANEDNTVAAVGVLHLLGKHGVPALLRARGMSVERVY